ncbi:MAG: hypothetical protein C6I05_01700 [Epsilonproteobacteria bacterium]|nr:hypothetical protein [Campylobacterota bacterium]
MPLPSEEGGDLSLELSVGVEPKEAPSRSGFDVFPLMGILSRLGSEGEETLNDPGLFQMVYLFIVTPPDGGIP